MFLVFKIKRAPDQTHAARRAFNFTVFPPYFEIRWKYSEILEIHLQLKYGFLQKIHCGTRDVNHSERAGPGVYEIGYAGRLTLEIKLKTRAPRQKI